MTTNVFSACILTCSISLLFYGIIDMVPSSSTSVCDIISEADLKEVISHTVNQVPHERKGPNYIHVSQVKDFSSAIMESVVSI